MTQQANHEVVMLVKLSYSDPVDPVKVSEDLANAIEHCRQENMLSEASSDIACYAVEVTPHIVVEKPEAAKVDVPKPNTLDEAIEKLNESVDTAALIIKSLPLLVRAGIGDLPTLDSVQDIMSKQK